MATTLDHIDEDRLRVLVSESLPYRELAVSISRADEKRLRRAIVAYNRDSGDGDFMDPTSDVDLAIVFAGAALRGMDANDADEGVWTDIDGVCRILPRSNRSPLRKRIRYAVRAGWNTWRAT